MDNTASKNEINVEAPLPLVAGKLRPWKRGRSCTPGAIAKFTPRDADRWIAGAQFRVEHGRDILTVAVERYVAEQLVAASSELVKIGSRSYWKSYPARTIPELVVVRVLAFEPKR